MAYVVQRHTHAKSSPAREDGDELWENYVHTIDGERGWFDSHSVAQLNGTLLFAGLFAIILAVFLVESSKSLSPDTGTQVAALLAQAPFASTIAPALSIDAEPFHVTRTTVVVNTLWYLALGITLMCALLAMLVQESMRGWARDQGLFTTETIEQYSLHHLAAHMGIRHYGLDHAPALIVGFLHVAIILFSTGLALQLFTLHFTPAHAFAIFAGLTALLYIVGSLIPLVHPSCPYRTPLTYLAFASYYTSVTLTACFILYLCFAWIVVRTWARTGILDGRILRPRLFLKFLQHPATSVRVLKRAIVYVFRRKFDEDLVDYIMGFMQAPRGQRFITPNELEYLEEHTRLMDLPDALRYLARCLINMTKSSCAYFFVDLRNDRRSMEHLVIVLKGISTVLGAVGAVRFVQILLFADAPGDDLSHDATDGDWRFEFMDPFLDAFAEFVRLLGPLNKKALSEKDTSLLRALTSFRWSLMLLLRRIRRGPNETSRAREKLQYLLVQLDSVDGIRMCALASGDVRSVQELFATERDPLPELAARIVWTLLAGEFHCGWPCDLEMLDYPYVPARTPSLWEFLRLFGGPRTSGQLPAPSDDLRELLGQARLQTATQAEAGSTVATPSSQGLESIVINALRDLGAFVDFPSSSQGRISGESGAQSSYTSITPLFTRATNGRPTSHSVQAGCIDQPQHQGLTVPRPAHLPVEREMVAINGYPSTLETGVQQLVHPDARSMC